MSLAAAAALKRKSSKDNSLDTPPARIELETLAQTYYNQTSQSILKMLEEALKKNVLDYKEDKIAGLDFKKKHDLIIQAAEDYALYFQKRIYPPRAWDPSSPIDPEEIKKLYIEFIKGKINNQELSTKQQPITRLISKTQDQNFIALNELVSVPNERAYRPLQDLISHYLIASETDNSAERIKKEIMKSTLLALKSTVLFKSISFKESMLTLVIKNPEKKFILNHTPVLFETEPPSYTQLNPSDIFTTSAFHVIKEDTRSYLASQNQSKNKVKTRHMIFLILENIWNYFDLQRKNRVSQKKTQSSKNSVSSPDLIALSQEEILARLFTAHYGKAQQLINDSNSSNSLAHQDELNTLCHKIEQVFKKPSVYSSMEVEDKVAIEKIYPEVFLSLIRQCAYAKENEELTGKKDEALPHALEGFGHKISSIFEKKLARDNKESKVLAQYLGHSR